MTSTDLARPFQADGMLAERDAVLAQVQCAIDQLNQAHERAIAAGLGGILRTYAREFEISVDPTLQRENLRRMRERLDNRGWARLLTVSGLRAWMDPQTTEKWDRDLREGNTPALEPSTIEATFATLAEQRGDMFKQAVLQCYRRVSWDMGPERKHSWEHKEEDGRPVALGARLVVEGFARISHPWEWNLENVADLDRLFAVLDGKPTHNHRAAFRGVWDGARLAERTEASTDYLHIRGFKNGSKHLTFLRPDLVMRLNEMVSAMAPALLPAPAKYLKRGSGKAMARAA